VNNNPAIQAGDIIRLRERLWRVDRLYRSEVQATAIDSYETQQRRFYMPLERIEKYAQVLPSENQIGDPANQSLYLQAEKLYMLHGSSPFVSLQRSSIIPTNYQLVPVVMSLRELRVRMLIADDVGLGKTIEAGLILSELIYRHLIRKILIITPASLREQWQEAMEDHFRLNFKIISSMHRRYLERELPAGMSPWDYYNNLITSIDYAKQLKNRNEILNYNWDMVVIDEAHLCAMPHNSKGNSSTMQRWEFLSKIAAKTQHLLLLTATPHNGYHDSFCSLLDSLDCGIIRGEDQIINKHTANKHVCQRTRHDVVEWLKSEANSFNPFPERDKRECLINQLHKTEIEVQNLIIEYGKMLLAGIKAGREALMMINFLILHLRKRALSSPDAIIISLERRIRKLKSGQIETEIKGNEASTIIREYDDLESSTIEEAGRRLEVSSFKEALTEYEITLLEKLLSLAKKLTPAKDSRLKKLTDEVLPELFRYNSKLIIFTRYKDTLGYLSSNLEPAFKDYMILSIHGEMNNARRKEVLEEFSTIEKGILIATDCISEGMNLQHLCNMMVHYELPWNPNRLEQRNGRIDRFGQQEDKVYIRQIIANNSIEHLVLSIIIRKTEQIRDDYGFAPPFLENESHIINLLQEAGMEVIKPATDSGQLDIFEQMEKQDLQFQETSSVDEESIQQILSDSFYGHTEISLPDVEAKLRETAATIGSAEEIKNFILSGLKHYNSKIDKLRNKEYKITAIDKRLQYRGKFEYEPVTFDPAHAARFPGCELIDLSHNLVVRLMGIIREEAANGKLNGRIAYRIASGNDITVLELIVRLSYVVKSTPQTLINEILETGYDLYEGEALDDDDYTRIKGAELLPGKRSKEEIIEDLETVWKGRWWEPEIIKKAELRKEELIAERKKLLEKLSLSEEREIMEGIDEIEFVRYEVLAINLIY
jgi:ERCC4-related helicase